MRLLLDANVPQKFRHHIVGHTVTSARFAGLQNLQNGALLVAMSGKFDVLITCDQSLPYQQSVMGRPLAVIVLLAPSNRIEDLLPLLGQPSRTIATVQHGKVYDVGPV
jgi:hypothetical protein